MTHTTQNLNEPARDPVPENSVPDSADAPPPGRMLGTVRVDARGRVYLKSLSSRIAPGSIYTVAMDDDSSAPATPPKSIRMRLIEED